MSALLWLPVVLSATLPNQPVEKSRPQDSPKKSIYKVDPLLDGSITLVGALAVAVPYGLSNTLIHPRCPCDPAEVNFIDRTVIGNHSDIADSLSNVEVAVAWLVPVASDLLDVGPSRELAEDMLVYAEALAVNGALVTSAKYIVQRPLPLVYAGLAPDLIDKPGGYRSFYSGHTSNAVTALMVASMTYTVRHGQTWWPWVLTGAYGLAVATERVLAGRHFPSDVAVGALSGVLVGWAIPRLHERTGATAAVTPIQGGAAIVVSHSL